MYINTRPFLHTPKEDTRRYQAELLGVLKDLDRVASENDVRYNLEAGSALGAVRENGFIPWDNDSDVLMPLEDVKKFLLGLARAGMFEHYDIWYYDSGWGWMIKDIHLAGILRDPDNYCEISLDWVISKITFAIFRLVRKETLTINMSLAKGTDTYQVAHFDTSLSTISLVFPKMLPEEKRTWRRRFLLKSEEYRVHPFVDIFPSITLDPDNYIKMKRGFLFRDVNRFFWNSLRAPIRTLGPKLSRYLPATNQQVAQMHSDPGTFEDYRVGVGNDYSKGVRRAKEARNKGENLVLSKTPWNLRKIIPYFESEIFPLKRIEFEDTTLSAPNDIIGILENHYKNFRERPPENERIQHAYHLDPTQFEQHVSINV